LFYATAYFRHVENVINRVNTLAYKPNGAVIDSIINRVYSNVGKSNSIGLEIGATLKDGTIGDRLASINKDATGSFKKVGTELELLTEKALSGAISQKELASQYTKGVVKAFESGEISKAQEDQFLLAMGGTKMEDLTITAWLKVQASAKTINKEMASDIQANFEKIPEQSVKGMEGVKRQFESLLIPIYEIFACIYLITCILCFLARQLYIRYKN
jgi:hypothetical protein